MHREQRVLVQQRQNQFEVRVLAGGQKRPLADVKLHIIIHSITCVNHEILILVERLFLTFDYSRKLDHFHSIGWFGKVW